MCASVVSLPALPLLPPAPSPAPGAGKDCLIGTFTNMILTIIMVIMIMTMIEIMRMVISRRSIKVL